MSGRREYRVPQVQFKLQDVVKKLPDYRPDILTQLRNWLKENPYLPPVSDEGLLLFAHSCYYDLENTKSCIECYYCLRSTTPEFFVKRDLNQPELKNALAVLEYAIFPKKTPEGYQVMSHRLVQYEPSKYVFADGVKLLNMTLEATMAIEGPQNGYLILFDMTGVKLGHLTRLSISLLKKFFTFIQEANPVRLKGIHVVNTMPILDKIMVLIKPFMKKELLSLLHFYSASELEKLYEFIPKDCLPSDFGGSLKSMAELHVENTARIGSLAQYWLDQETMAVDDSKKPKKKDKKRQMEEIPDIRKLELD